MTRLNSAVVSWLGAWWRSDEWQVSRNFRYNIDKSPNCGIEMLDVVCEI